MDLLGEMLPCALRHHRNVELVLPPFVIAECSALRVLVREDVLEIGCTVEEYPQHVSIGDLWRVVADKLLVVCFFEARPARAHLFTQLLVLRWSACIRGFETVRTLPPLSLPTGILRPRTRTAPGSPR